MSLILHTKTTIFPPKTCINPMGHIQQYCGHVLCRQPKKNKKNVRLFLLRRAGRNSTRVLVLRELGENGLKTPSPLKWSTRVASGCLAAAPPACGEPVVEDSANAVPSGWVS